MMEPLLEPLNASTKDCVEYSIYIVESLLTEKNRRPLLRAIELASQQLCQKLLSDYLWHRENFSFKRLQYNGVSFLQGKTVFADCVEDEWLIVYLLLELSKRFQTAWIRVCDTDGEFLLIEAAKVIPKWLNPEIADNRVWINQGRLMIIPMTLSNEGQDIKPNTSLTISQALQLIKIHAESLLHIPVVEDEAFYRVRKYPAQITRNLHCTQAILPRKLALILHKRPAYICPAIEAFCLRDYVIPSDINTIGTEKLAFPPDDLVQCPVKFTKVGFAQIKAQQPQMPSVRRVSTSVTLADNVPNSAWAEVGMKVTSGFEILLSGEKHQDLRAVRETKLILDDLENGGETLPSDDEILGWGTSADDESWLDINWEDFEEELSNRGAKNGSNGFGDPDAQENLRRLVSRFEDFLEDDSSELEGLEHDDMDEDEDLGAEGSSEMAQSGDGGTNGEDELTGHIRQILGMSVGTMKEIMSPSII